MTDILFIYRNSRKFIQQDLDILGRSFAVRPINVHGWRAYPRILLNTQESDVVYVWFANWWAVWAAWIAKRAGKPCIIVGGGYDVVDLPEIKYGLMGHPILGPLARKAFHTASAVTTFSQHSSQELKRHTGIVSKVIYCGVDTDKYCPKGEKKPTVITVGHVTKSNIKRKGLLDFVQAAHFLPGVTFRIIGKHTRTALSTLTRFAPPNVSFTGFVPEDRLISELQASQVYVQASWHEGFGLALAEAMACGCTPVVTGTGALPEVVGNCGYYVPLANPRDLAEGISAALQTPLRERARDRIASNFPIKRRGREIVSLVNQIAP